jgi:signal transduction histidine kinase
MKKFFRYFPLPVKLILIAFFPVVFMLILTYQLYDQKKQSIASLHDFQKEIDHAQNILNLVNELQAELRLSYVYVINKEEPGQLFRQWVKTDSLIQVAKLSALAPQNRFAEYTFINDLPAIRKRIKSGITNPDEISSSYITTIFRLNSLEINRVSARRTLSGVRKSIASQKKLSQLLAYYNIMRLNIYNALQSRTNLQGTLHGLTGVYSIYKSYEKEFQLTADTAIYNRFTEVSARPSSQKIAGYFNYFFTNYTADSSLTADLWWKVSDKVNEDLKLLINNQREDVRNKLTGVMEAEKKSLDRYILYMIITIVLILIITNYAIYTITSMLNEIRSATRKISSGITGITFSKYPRDVIGSLVKSIIYIDRNNQQLARAAESIGKGNFHTEVKPRSKQDVLGNAIEHMKEDLAKYTNELKHKQQELTKAVLNGQEKERSRLGLELHDNINQLLTAARLYISHMQRMPEEREELMVKTKEIIHMAIEEIRKLSKILVQPALQINDLNNSINELAKDMLIGTGISFTFNTNGIADKNIPDEMKVTLYRIVQEQLNNIIKYAEADIVIVSIEQNGDQIRLTIQDDGKGFDPEAARRGIGLSNIFSRAEVFDGNVEIKSAPWQGCQLKVELYTPAYTVHE